MKLCPRLNPPESSFILGIAYDSLKCEKFLQGILDYLDMAETENFNCKKNLTELSNNISKFTKTLTKTNNLNYEVSCEILKELTDMEDQFSEIYIATCSPQQSKLLQMNFQSSPALNLNNFKKIFENFVEQKQKHRETLIEIIYCLEPQKNSERLRTMAPHSNTKPPTHGSTNPPFTPLPIPTQRNHLSLKLTIKSC